MEKDTKDEIKTSSSGKKVRIVKTVRPSTVSSFTGLKSLSQSKPPQGSIETIQPLASDQSELPKNTSTTTDKLLSTPKITSSKSETVAINPKKSIDQSTLTTKESNIETVKTRKLPPPPLSSALTPAQQLAERERQESSSTPSKQTIRKLPPPPLSSALTPAQQLAERERQKSSSTPSKQTIIKSSESSGFYPSIKKQQKTLNVSAEEFVPDSKSRSKTIKKSIQKPKSLKSTKSETKFNKRQNERKTQKELEKIQEYQDEINFQNFNKETIIRETNKFRKHLDIQTSNIDIDNALESTFNEVKTQKNNLELENISLTDLEQCNKDICKLWENNEYFDLLSKKETNQASFINGNIIFKLKIKGKIQTVRIPRYIELNEYLRNLKIKINRANLIDSNCDDAIRLDQVIEKIYKSLHTIYSSDTNKLNRNDNILQQLTILYMNRKSLFTKENKDDWNSVSSKYKELQSKVEKNEQSVKVFVEPPVISIGNQLYVILKNPQIMD